MTEFLPLPAPRPTVTHANCTVSAINGFRPLHLDLHLPPGDGPFPVVLWIHGGAYFEGSRVWLPDTVAPHGFHERLLARGYAVADVDYRLSAEAPYPAQLVDVEAAVRWLRHHAAALQLDPARFAALGESAGGHLALMAGLTSTGDAALQAIVSWYSPVDLSAPLDEGPGNPIVPLLGGPASARLDFARWASPLHRVHAGAPPIHTIHGQADDLVPVTNGVQLTEALQALGVRATLRTVDGAGHCFAGYDDIAGLIEESADFLDEVFAPTRNQ